jgi:hypothetical protein
VNTIFEEDEALRGLTRSVDCREHSCRVEIRDTPGVDLMKQLPLIAAKLGSQLPNLTVERVDHGGYGATVLYLSENAMLPLRTSTTD